MTFTHPHFAEPHWLWLAFLGPVALAALQVYSGWARRRQLAQIAAPHFVAELTRSHSPLRRALKNGLLLFAVAGVGLTLARPQWGEQAAPGHMLGHDIVFVLDCSRSMLATDVTPSRLQRAKLAILDFMHRHGRGRLGLVAFAGQAFLQCPLTFDYGAFEETLLAVDDKTIPIPGTDIGGGDRSEEHTSELQSPYDLVCRLLLEKKKKDITLLQYTQSLARETTKLSASRHVSKHTN